MLYFFFFNDTATTEIYTLSLHDALPILRGAGRDRRRPRPPGAARDDRGSAAGARPRHAGVVAARPPRGDGRAVGDRRRRSEEHTSELQSRQYLVCRLLLEKKKKNININE